MKYIVGIDPGLSGGIAFYESLTGSIETIPMPVLKAGTNSKNVIDELELARLFDSRSCDIKKVFIERVHAMPKQGVTSVYTFGVGYGILRGIVAANFLPVEFVTPQKWKACLRVPAQKDASRARANEIFPAAANQWNLSKWDGRAEAAMIAYYGATLQN